MRPSSRCIGVFLPLSSCLGCTGIRSIWEKFPSSYHLGVNWADGHCTRHRTPGSIYVYFICLNFSSRYPFPPYLAVEAAPYLCESLFPWSLTSPLLIMNSSRYFIYFRWDDHQLSPTQLDGSFLAWWLPLKYFLLAQPPSVVSKPTQMGRGTGRKKDSHTSYLSKVC